MTPNDQPEAEKLTLTREQILAMPAGRSLDALVAERIFGWHHYEPRDLNPFVCDKCGFGIDRADHYVPSNVEHSYHLPPYSIEIAHAFEVVEKVRGEHRLFELKSPCSILSSPQAFYWYASFPRAGVGIGLGETAPLAICRAALLCAWKDVEVRK